MKIKGINANEIEIIPETIGELRELDRASGQYMYNGEPYSLTPPKTFDEEVREKNLKLLERLEDRVRLRDEWMQPWTGKIMENNLENVCKSLAEALDK